MPRYMDIFEEEAEVDINKVQTEIITKDGRNNLAWIR